MPISRWYDDKKAVAAAAKHGAGLIGSIPFYSPDGLHWRLADELTADGGAADFSPVRFGADGEDQSL